MLEIKMSLNSNVVYYSFFFFKKRTGGKLTAKRLLTCNKEDVYFKINVT